MVTMMLRPCSLRPMEKEHHGWQNISRMRLGSHCVDLEMFQLLLDESSVNDGKPKLRINVLTVYGPIVRPLT